MSPLFIIGLQQTPTLASTQTFGDHEVTTVDVFSTYMALRCGVSIHLTLICGQVFASIYDI